MHGRKEKGHVCCCHGRGKPLPTPTPGWPLLGEASRRNCAVSGYLELGGGCRGWEPAAEAGGGAC